MMGKFFTILLMTQSLSLCAQSSMSLSKSVLQDKIKGGWAGQVIGVTFGGPVEFRFQGTMINDYQPIVWYDGYIKKTMIENPGLYDDLYMDLTFVDVFEKKGLNAPIEEHAKAYANAGYMLWHANQSGRYNVLNGIRPPDSGHWLQNPHADDIDFQIEADFSGLMAPGMPNTAATIGDGIGHIMNYGDGWYGGVYIGAMYSLAFTSQNIRQVVTQGLRTIPEQSTFYKCISDVITWHDRYPQDWKQTWLEIQKKWSDEVGCPDGVFHPFNIDAKLNSAYVVLGLLYGDGDFTKTMEISTRAGQDADCNPSSAGGILGTLLGYEKIPTQWKLGLKESEGIKFKYTTLSLNDVYELSVKHALNVISLNGGKINGDQITLAVQEPKAVRLEQSFPDIQPIEKRTVGKKLENEFTFDFTGTGFVLKCDAKPKQQSGWDYKGDFKFNVELYIDGKLIETAAAPANYTIRRNELFWKYQLSNKSHNVKVRLMNPDKEFDLMLSDIIIYTSSTTKK